MSRRAVQSFWKQSSIDNVATAGSAYTVQTFYIFPAKSIVSTYYEQR